MAQPASPGSSNERIWRTEEFTLFTTALSTVTFLDSELCSAEDDTPEAALGVPIPYRPTEMLSNTGGLIGG